MLRFWWIVFKLMVGSPNHKVDAAKALRNYGTRAVKPLIQALKKGNWELQLVVAELLGRIGDVRTVVELIPLLGDERTGVKCAAAIALGVIGDERAVAPLIKAFETVYGEALLKVFAWAFEKFGDARAVGPLIKKIKFAKYAFPRGPVPVGTAAIIQALGGIGDARAVEPLFDLLSVSNVSKPCLESLESILERSAVNVKDESLEKIANLPIKIKYEYCTHSPSSFLPSHFYTDLLNCSYLKRLAQEQLMHRKG